MESTNDSQQPVEQLERGIPESPHGAVIERLATKARAMMDAAHRAGETRFAHQELLKTKAPNSEEIFTLAQVRRAAEHESSAALTGYIDEIVTSMGG